MALPHLVADIAAAPMVQESSYTFSVFSIGERGTSLGPDLVEEVVRGLVTAVNKVEFDTLVSIHVTGAMWALAVAHALRKPLKLFVAEPNGDPTQLVFQQQRPYLARTVYAPDLQNAGRCVLLDDVLSGGGTLGQVHAAVTRAGATTVLAVCVVDKRGVAADVSTRLGMPVVCLATNS